MYNLCLIWIFVPDHYSLLSIESAHVLLLQETWFKKGSLKVYLSLNLLE